MSLMTLLLLAAGLTLLWYGAELLVRGASMLAVSIGVSRLAIGLTVVAYGTSMPEMAVSALTSWQGQAGISIGNVVGSNIFNRADGTGTGRTECRQHHRPGLRPASDD